MEDLIKFGTLSPKAAQFLELCVKGALNIVISGGTGSGKTTTLNVMSGAIPNDNRIITVEDAAEVLGSNAGPRVRHGEHGVAGRIVPPDADGHAAIEFTEAGVRQRIVGSRAGAGDARGQAGAIADR
jgi:pilus assembly protein CpaF